MTDCLNIIKKVFPELSEKGGVPCGFNVISDIDDQEMTPILSCNTGLCLKWGSGNGKHIIAYKEAEPCSFEDLSDKLEEFLASFLNINKTVMLNINEVIIDNLHGLEVLGKSVISGRTDCFCALYLSDDEKGYIIIGFGHSNPNFDFEPLSLAARNFYRHKKSVETSYDDGIVAAFQLAEYVPADMVLNSGGWYRIYADFYYESGEIKSRPSLKIVYKHGLIELDPAKAYYKEKDFRPFIDAVLETSGIEYADCISVCIRYDGKYDLTYKIAVDSHIDEEHSCNDECAHEDGECSCGHNRHEYKAFNRSDYMKELADICEYASSGFPEDWERGLAVTVCDDEGISVYAYNSSGKGYEITDIPDNAAMFDSAENSFDLLHDIINSDSEDKHKYIDFIDEAVIVQLVEFKKKNGVVDRESIIFKNFGFSFFIDEEKPYISFFNKLLSFSYKFSDYFNNEPFSCISFKMVLEKGKAAEPEQAFGLLNGDMVPIELGKNRINEVKKVLKSICREFEGDRAGVVIFPHGPIGFSVRLGSSGIDAVSNM